MVTATLIGGAIINLYIHIFGLSSQVNQFDKYSSYLQWELWGTMREEDWIPPFQDSSLENLYIKLVFLY